MVESQPLDTRSKRKFCPHFRRAVAEIALLVNGLLEAILRIEHQQIGIAEEVYVTRGALLVHFVIFAVSSIHHDFVAALEAVGVGAARMGEQRHAHLYACDLDGFLRVEQIPGARRTHVIQRYREENLALLVLKTHLEIRVWAMEMEGVARHVHRVEERHTLYVIPVRMRQENMRRA